MAPAANPIKTIFLVGLPLTYLFVGIAFIIFVVAIVVPVINVYMGGFIDMPT